MLKKHSDLFAGLLFVAIGALIATQLSSIRITEIAMDSRMMPRICMILLFFLGGILVIKWGIAQQIRRKREQEKTPKETDKKSIVRVLLCIAIFAVFIALMQPIGFIAAGIIYLLLTFFVIVPNAVYRRELYIASAVVPVVVYFLFTRVFHLILPTGTLW